jgi:predicted phosphoribosyltransferase
MIREMGISSEDVDDIVSREQQEMHRREKLYRAGLPALDLRGRTALVIDDGLATGNTMLAAVGYARSLEPASIVIGVPVGSGEACDRLRAEADDLVCLATPELFFAVGQWYTEFQQVGDAEVQRLLAESREKMRKHAASTTAA